MRRREFIMLLSCAAAIWPLAARAQQPERVRRVGVLVGLAENDPEMKERIAGLRWDLRSLVGWKVVTCKSTIVLRPPALSLYCERTDRAAARRDLDAVNAGHRRTMQQETRTIPIVFASVADPIGSGFVASLSRPGGNLDQGLLDYEEGITGKWLAMLKGNCTNLTRAALVANPRTAAFDYFLQSPTEAPSLAIDLVPTPVDNAADIERAIKTFAREPNGELVLPPDTSTVVHRNLIIALAAQHRLPAVYAIRVFVAAGGLMSYGTDFVDLSRQGASFVASCAVQNPLTFRCRRRRSSKLSSTVKRRRHLA